MSLYKNIANLAIGLKALLEPVEIVPGMSLNSDTWRAGFHVPSEHYATMTPAELESSFLMPALRSLVTRMGRGKRWRVGDDAYPIALKSGAAWRKVYQIHGGLPVELLVTYQDSRLLTPDPSVPKGRYYFTVAVHAQEVPLLTGDESHDLYRAFSEAGCCVHDLPLNGLQALIDRWEEIRVR